MKRSGPLPAKSARRAAEDRAYLRFVAELAEESQACEVGDRIWRVDPHWWARSCRLRMEGLHHLKKRSQGGGRMERANVLRSCNPCNGWVEDHPRLAATVGLVITAGDG